MSRKNNYLNLNNKIKINRKFLWNNSLLCFNNQIKALNNIFEDYIKNLYTHTHRDDFIVIELYGKSVESISSLFDIKKTNKALIHYSGLDINDEIIKYSKICSKKFVNNFFPSTSNLSVSLEEINWSEFSLSLLIFNNIPYYAFNIKDFISNLFYTKSDKQKVIFVNESPLSDLGYLRNNFGNNFNSENYSEVIMYLEKKYIPFKMSYFDIIINFPNYEDKIWNNLYKIDCNRVTTDQHYTEAKALLEYIVQKPLETLFEDNLLKKYLDKVRVLLKKQNNQIISKNTLFLVK